MFTVLDRMTTFLFLVGFLGEFPVYLSRRIGGCANWNRHIQYAAVKAGYIEIIRCKHNEHTVRSARLTQAGLNYVCEMSPSMARYLLSIEDILSPSNRHRDIVRNQALATGHMMAINAGAIFLPDQKPSLLLHSNSTVSVDREKTYYYTSAELRHGIQEFDPDISSKTSRLLGVIIQDTRCLCMYYTGYSRMYWVAKSENHIVDSIDTLLKARGFRCTEYSQVLIADRQKVAETIAEKNINGMGKYFTVSDSFAHTYFISNDENGDKLLKLIVNPALDLAAKRQYLSQYSAPHEITRSYDAITQDGSRPVILGYHFDLLTLLSLDEAPDGFFLRPILLCYEYQVDCIQKIVGPQIDVRPIQEEADE